MPKPTLDVGQVTQVLAMMLAPNQPELELEMINDHHKLNERLRAGPFSWNAAATILGIAKNKLYHWYEDTFTRNLYEKLTSEDLQIVKSYVRSCFAKQAEPQREKLLTLLHREYNHKVLKVAFRNACQVCKSDSWSSTDNKASLEHIKIPSSVRVGFELTPRDEQDEFVFVADDWM